MEVGEGGGGEREGRRSSKHNKRMTLKILLRTGSHIFMSILEYDEVVHISLYPSMIKLTKKYGNIIMQ